MINASCRIIVRHVQLGTISVKTLAINLLRVSLAKIQTVYDAIQRHKTPLYKAVVKSAEKVSHYNLQLKNVAQSAKLI